MIRFFLKRFFSSKTLPTKTPLPALDAQDWDNALAHLLEGTPAAQQNIEPEAKRDIPSSQRRRLSYDQLRDSSYYYLH